MKTYIALLRGINVGGHNKLPMKDLSSMLLDEGFVNVKTYIQSGNVVFQSEDVVTEQAISALINTHFGFIPPVMLLSPEQLSQALNNSPFDETDGKLLHFYFCQETPQPDLALLDKYKAETESYQLIDKVFYLHAPNGIGRSKLAERVEKAMGVPVTARNLNTVNKLLGMV